jgi:hypothetical protein
VGLVFEYSVNHMLPISRLMARHNWFYGIFCGRYLVAAVSLQSVWSLTLAILDIYAILVRRRFRHPRVISLFAIGDGVRNSFLGI